MDNACGYEPQDRCSIHLRPSKFQMLSLESKSSNREIRLATDTVNQRPDLIKIFAVQETHRAKADEITGGSNKFGSIVQKD